METTIENHAGQEYNVFLFYSHIFKENSHYIIECQVTINGISTILTTHYNNFVGAIDTIMDMNYEGMSQGPIQQEYHDNFFLNIKEKIIHFTYEVEAHS